MFKVLDPICEPKRATKYSAAVDLFAREDVIIGAGETKIVPLGVKIDLDTFMFEDFNQLPLEFALDVQINSIQKFLSSHYIAIFIRSSLALKGLIIPNGQRVIDLDYPDEIGLILHYPINYNQVEFVGCQEANYDGGDRQIPDDYLLKISKGDKIAQAMLMEHKSYLMGYESDAVRDGGFGSSGEKR